MWDFISVLQILIPTNQVEGHYLHLHMRKQPLVKVATGFSDRKAGLFSTIQVGSCWRVLWRRSWGGEPWVVSANVETPPPRLRSRFYLRTALLLPVGGVGRPKPRPLSCFGPEGWREKAIRRLGQISILSWKLAARYNLFTPIPTLRICLLQPTEGAGLSRQPSPIFRQTL